LGIGDWRLAIFTIADCRLAIGAGQVEPGRPFLFASNYPINRQLPIVNLQIRNRQ
jgi:hypothetical protein